MAKRSVKKQGKLRMKREALLARVAEKTISKLTKAKQAAPTAMTDGTPAAPETKAALAMAVAENAAAGRLKPSKLMLSDLQKALPEVSAARIRQPKNSSPFLQAAPKSKVLRSKNRQRTGNAEIEHFGKVLQHPVFLASPLATIQQHVVNTIQQDKDKEMREAALAQRVADRTQAPSAGAKKKVEGPGSSKKTQRMVDA
eukprot:TRINITY_DN15438_c0_g1_i1.p1 TRINITY_DN15438_c0_g1~~TRINITY_DN15438_c0_g1_i1.p1  ORF type:complete len:199 (+),score=53.83 TRINITY_DN15438_c0_g1_i1:3-599(+)